MSPLAPETDAATAASTTIITVTPEAHAELVTLRDTEPDADRLGLRLEIMSGPGEDFRYDLSFEVVTKAAFTDDRLARLDLWTSVKGGHARDALRHALLASRRLYGTV